MAVACSSPQEVEGRVEFRLIAPSGEPIGPLFRVAGHAENILGTSLSADGTRVGIRTGTNIQVWNTVTGRPVGSPVTSLVKPGSPELSPDGQLLAWRSSGKVVVWDIEKARERFRPLEVTGKIYPMEFSPDSRRLLTVSDSSGAELSSAQVWDVVTGTRLGRPMNHAAPMNSAAFSPDGQLVVSASQDRTARVWDAQTGEPRGPLLEHPSEVHLACFGHDQRRVYTACEDGLVRSWDAATGEPVAASLDHQHPARYVLPLLGGRVLHTTSQHNHSWELAQHPRPIREWEDLAELLSGRRLTEAGQLRVLEVSELSNLWHRLKVRLPEEFVTSLAQREDWNNWMTQHFFANKHHSKARVYLNELVALQPARFIHRWNRAYANRNPGHWDEAVADLQEAARLDPAENAVWADLAMAELIRGNLPGYQAACATMTERLSFADRKVYLGDWCFVACHATNRPALWQNLERLLVEMGPPSEPTLYTRGRDWQYYAARGALAYRLGRPAENARTPGKGARHS
jgi:tetratricopeptide (TPR) repeat protein